MKSKKIFLCVCIILLIVISIIILKNVTKNKKNGNTMNSQKIVDKILNLKSYKAKIYVQVKSNKNKNKYILSQEYNTEKGCIQEVIEPANIAGIKIIKKEDKLIIQNTELNLNTIIERYKGLEENCLDLNVFIKDYIENSNSIYEEKNGKIIMKTSPEKSSKYLKNKILYINKEDAIPTKLLIQDNNQNTTIIIEYNEIELN